MDGTVGKTEQQDTQEEPLCITGQWYECSEGPWRGACVRAKRYCFGTFWGECVGEVLPVPEVCDNADNDCDGVVDNGVRNACNECGEVPIEICDETDNDCDGQVNEGFSEIDELCNGIDDDCDGSIDEGWSKRLACDIEDDNPWIVYNDEDFFSTCVRGWRECREGGITECFDFIGPEPEVCDGFDNDCDGDVDDMAGLGGECGPTDVGECAFGHDSCIEAEITCYGAVLPENEICDGLDNDCDGSMDEGLVQECSTNCGRGIEHCSGGQWINCDAPAATQEICDGLDNNCNGAVDEDLECPCILGQTQVCRNNSPMCGYGIQTCLEGGTWSECVGEVPQLELCNNYDDDCDLQIDENITRDCYMGPPETLGVAECVAGTESCFRGVWMQCLDQILPSDEVCDGLDNDCDGLVDNMERIFEKADIIFAVDISGSMSSIIEALLEGIEFFATSLDGSEHRFGIVTFGQLDGTGEPQLLLQLSSVSDLIATLGNIRADGGVEPSLDVVYQIASPSNPLLINWRNDATPFVLLFTDEVAQSSSGLELETLSEVLNPCVLPGCNNATNEDWPDGDPLELFVFTMPVWNSPWNLLVPTERQHLFNIARMERHELLEIDLGLVFSEICLEE
jgi:hypothetical protein